MMYEINLVETTWYNVERDMKIRGITQFKQDVIKNAFIQIMTKVIEGQYQNTWQIEQDMKTVVAKLIGH